jgi:hypothetical protein
MSDEVCSVNERRIRLMYVREVNEEEKGKAVYLNHRVRTGWSTGGHDEVPAPSLRHVGNFNFPRCVWLTSDEIIYLG